MPICPICHSPNLRRSHSRTFLERTLKRVQRRTYRCRDCDWRGSLSAPRESRGKTAGKAITLNQVILIIATVIIGVILLIYLVNRIYEDDGSGSPSPQAGSVRSVSAKFNLSNLKTHFFFRHGLHG